MNGINMRRLVIRGFIGALFTRLLAACTESSVPREVETGAVANSGRVIASAYLGEWVPNTRIMAVKVRLLDQTEETRAILLRANGARQLIGPYIQLDDITPIRIVHFEIAATRYVAGLIDSRVTGSLDSIEMWHDTPSPAGWLNATKAAKIFSDRSFVFPIFQQEYDEWRMLKGVYVKSLEYFAAFRAESDASRAEKRPMVVPPPPFEKVFSPPVALDRLMTKIG